MVEFNYYNQGMERYKRLLKEAEDYRNTTALLKTRRQPQPWWLRLKRNLIALLS